MRLAAVVVLTGALVASGCGPAAQSEPKEIICKVISWADPASLTIPLDPGADGLSEELVVAESLLVEFSFRNRLRSIIFGFFRQTPL